jgi:hypothetical protein
MNIVLTDEYPNSFLLSLQNKRGLKSGRGDFRNLARDSVLFHTDWDFPSLASALGWNIRKVQRKHGYRCDHISTDGTVDCKECSMTASEFISAAAQWLHDNDGRVFRNKGMEYFE